MKFLRQYGEADLLRQVLLQVAGDERNGTLLLPILVLRGLALEEGDFQVVNAAAEFILINRLQDIVCDLKP